MNVRNATPLNRAGRSRAPESCLVVTTSYPRTTGDAAGHFIKSEVDHMVQEGFCVTVAAAGAKSEVSEVHSLGGQLLFDHPGALVRLRENPLRLWGLCTATYALQALRKKALHFDRLLCHWLLPCAYPWGILLKDCANRREAVAHGSDVRILLRLPTPLRNHVLSSIFKADFSLRFVSDELKVALLDSCPPRHLRAWIEGATVQPSPIDCSAAPTRKAAREQLGLREDEHWGVFVGRLIEAKRPEVALSAATLVPNLNVAVVGQGPLGEELRARFADCLFLGQLPREETLTWMAAADVLIAASRHEGAPTAVREARALQTNVVAVCCGDLTQWASEDSGLWVVGD